MLVKKIIPCLDLKDGRVVKGVKFVDIRDAGDPVAVAQAYTAAGADELVMLDITATVEGRTTMLDLVSRIAQATDLPLTVGGGLASLADIERTLAAGADSVALASAALAQPELIRAAAEKFGSQRIVVAIDAKKQADASFAVYAAGGRQRTGQTALVWARQVAELGAGRILLTSMDKDGTNTGYDLELTNQVAAAVPVPVIASGGAGSLADFYDVLSGGASAALAASLFHFGQINLAQLKRYLLLRNIKVKSPAGGPDQPQAYFAAGTPLALPDAAAMIWQRLNKDSQGLVPVIVQEKDNGLVLMQAFTNEAALAATLSTGLMHYYSRSRQSLWLKGEKSGHFQQVQKLWADCDQDCLLALVQQYGPACHTGAKTCFAQPLAGLLD